MACWLMPGEDDMSRFASALAPRLLGPACQTNCYLAATLGLREELACAMRALETAKFERVLHPIFEEDELTLIAVGGILGGLAGYGQTFFY